MPNVIMPNAIMPNAIKPNAIKPNVIAPFKVFPFTEKSVLDDKGANLIKHFWRHPFRERAGTFCLHFLNFNMPWMR